MHENPEIPTTPLAERYDSRELRGLLEFARQPGARLEKYNNFGNAKYVTEIACGKERKTLNSDFALPFMVSAVEGAKGEIETFCDGLGHLIELLEKAETENK
ncbi:MAG: hypothetical protein V1856_01530 [Candidatus Liptonbacteria bacterium]